MYFYFYSSTTFHQWRNISFTPKKKNIEEKKKMLNITIQIISSSQNSQAHQGSRNRASLFHSIVLSNETFCVISLFIVSFHSELVLTENHLFLVGDGVSNLTISIKLQLIFHNKMINWKNNSDDHMKTKKNRDYALLPMKYEMHEIEIWLWWGD